MTALNHYCLIYQFIMYLYLCWNLYFLLGLVGIRIDQFSPCVGTKNCTNTMMEGFNKTFTTCNQHLNGFLRPWLDCLTVGTENDPSPKLKK